MSLTFISLFAGIGGFDLGLERAGHTCVAQVECDEAALGVLAHRWPDVPRFDDVRTVGAHNLPACDLVCGGFPCQDLSVAGQRAGLAGARSGLFYEMTRIVDELRPAFLLWENVPGLLSSGRGRDFAAVLMELERIGYSGCWTTLDAQFFGLAQRRQRIFGLFARRDIGAARCAEILSLAARLPWNTPPRPQARAGVASALTRSAARHGGASPRGDGSDNLIAHTLTANYGKQVDSSDTSKGPPNLILSTPVAASLTSGTATGAGVNKPGRRREDDYNLVAFTQNTRDEVRPIGGEGAIAGALAAQPGMKQQTYVARALQRGARYDGDSETFLAGALGASDGGLDDNSGQAGHIVAVSLRGREGGATAELSGEQMPALRASQGGGDKPHALIPSGVRRLTPTECERLQGFPDGWTAEGVNGPQADSARYRQLGNAVAVPVAAWIGQRLAEELV